MVDVIVPDELVECEMVHIHSGACPVCGGPGPVDVFLSHWVASFILVTHWGTHVALSCRPCRNKQWLKDTTLTMAVGWWGFPNGVVRTPISLVRNAWEFYLGPGRNSPSARVRAIAQSRLHGAVAEACMSAESLECPRCRTGYVLSEYKSGQPLIHCLTCGGAPRTTSVEPAMFQPPARSA